MKLLKATEQAYDLESQKRDILQEFIDDYETNIYRVDRFYKISSINRFFFFFRQENLVVYQHHIV